jgi:CIC family chloride channel protein
LNDSQITQSSELRRAARGRRALQARFKRWFQVRWFALARRLGLSSREELTFAVLAPVIGALTGLTALAITWAISAFQGVLWGDRHHLLEAAREAPVWVKIGAPVAGGMVLAVLIAVFRQEVKGHGMSGIIESVALRGGFIAPGQSLLREVAGIATVGSGGSLGREGPMIRTGSMLASLVGRISGLEGRRLKVLIGCGAAAGMAAAYNAPVGAALFAMEVILGNFAVEIFGPVVVASVLATVIVRAVRGDAPVYDIPPYQLVSAWELPAYLVLGLLGGALSVAFTRGVRSGERVFARVPFLSNVTKPIVGAAAVGAIGILFPEVYGNGFDAVNLSLRQHFSIGMLAILPLVKGIATATTLGSGGAGGLFTPALFVGALLGGLFGSGVHAVLGPDFSAGYGAYALVGMGAITAGTSHAPISSLIVIFEMTGYDGKILIPLMLATMASTFVARRIYPHSIYTEALARRGITLPSRLEELVMEQLTAATVLRRSSDTASSRTPLKALVERFLSSRQKHLHVVDEGVFVGAISLHDVKHVIKDGSLDGVIAADLIDRDHPFVFAEDRLSRVLGVFADQDVDRLPVVEGDPPRYLGLVTKQDLLRIYAQEVLRRPARLARIVREEDGAQKTDFVELPPGYEIREIEVPPQLAGETLASAELPKRYGVWVIAVNKRNERGDWDRCLAQADSRLAAGDRILGLGPGPALDRLARAEPDAPAKQGQVA